MKWYGMEGKCMFVQKYQGKASYGRVLVDNAIKAKSGKGIVSKGKTFSGKACKVTACHGKVCTYNAYKDKHVRIMHVAVWNVREMHVWAEMSGECIIGQVT
jgi:hypothetical protein